MDTRRPFGMSVVVKRNRYFYGIVVHEVSPNSLVALDGRIKKGFILLEINGISLDEYETPEAAVNVLSSAVRQAVESRGQLKLTCSRGDVLTPAHNIFRPPQSEPVRPIDPTAWVQHTNAARAPPVISPSMLIPTKTSIYANAMAATNNNNNNLIAAVGKVVKQNALFTSSQRARSNNDNATIMSPSRTLVLWSLLLLLPLIVSLPFDNLNKDGSEFAGLAEHQMDPEEEKVMGEVESAVDNFKMPSIPPKVIPAGARKGLGKARKAFGKHLDEELQQDEPPPENPKPDDPAKKPEGELPPPAVDPKEPLPSNESVPGGGGGNDTETTPPDPGNNSTTSGPETTSDDGSGSGPTDVSDETNGPVVDGSTTDSGPKPSSGNNGWTQAGNGGSANHLQSEEQKLAHPHKSEGEKQE
uniref:PDZ domain-containing protein n=1 Tax=Meloidogyne javanica TaxID=6303 RepID=A0A915LU43_MELJA